MAEITYQMDQIKPHHLARTVHHLHIDTRFQSLWKSYVVDSIPINSARTEVNRTYFENRQRELNFLASLKTPEGDKAYESSNRESVRLVQISRERAKAGAAVIKRLFDSVALVDLTVPFESLKLPKRWTAQTTIIETADLDARFHYLWQTFTRYVQEVDRKRAPENCDAMTRRRLQLDFLATFETDEGRAVSQSAVQESARLKNLAEERARLDRDRIERLFIRAALLNHMIHVNPRFSCGYPGSSLRPFNNEGNKFEDLCFPAVMDQARPSSPDSDETIPCTTDSGGNTSTADVSVANPFTIGFESLFINVPFDTIEISNDSSPDDLSDIEAAQRAIWVALDDVEVTFGDQRNSRHQSSAFPSSIS